MHPRAFFDATGLKPKKTLDQFFLDDRFLDKEVELAGLEKKDVVLEIGAGFGSLTRKIAAHASVLAVEKDGRFLPYLWKIQNCVAIGNDVLRVLKEGRVAGRHVFTKVMGNIPYSTSQDILLEVLKHPWERAVLCFQKEFVAKLHAHDKLGLLVRECCDVRIAAHVPASAFYPKAVDSAIVVLEQSKPMDEEYWHFLQKVFRARNKHLKNTVSDCPARFAGKKPTQLTAAEMWELYRTVLLAEK